MSKKQSKHRRPEKAPERKPDPNPPRGGTRSRGGRGWRFRLFGVALLFALGVAAYANSFHGGWQFDDFPNVIENLYLRLPALDLHSLGRAMLQDGKQNRPFSNLTLALNYYVGGEEVWGYHLINCLLHCLTGAAVFIGLGLIFRRAGLAPERRDLAALLAAAVWLVHPLHPQAVSYIVQRQTVMASCLMLWTLVAYLAAREAGEPKRRRILYLLAGLAFLGAAGSKEIALITPALILIFELYFYQNFSFAFIRRRPLAVATALLLMILGLLFALRPEMRAKIFQGYHDFPFTLSERLLTEPRVLIQYLSLILWPVGSRLSFDHDPLVSTSWFHPWSTAPAILLWLALLAGAVGAARRRPLLSLAVWWYLLNLAMESSFIPLDLMFEHRLYLASLALIVPLAAGIVLAARKTPWATIGLAAVILLLMVNTAMRNRVWQTETTLWRDCVRKVPDKARPYLGLGKLSREKGFSDRALRYFNLALKKNPRYADAYYYFGLVYAEQGRYDLAAENYSRALELSPQYTLAYINRGNVYDQQGRSNQALSDLNRAVELSPQMSLAYLNRGIFYFNHEAFERALADFTRVIELYPNYAKAYNNRGTTYDQLGKTDQAIADYTRALELNPNYALAYFNRGVDYQKQGRTGPAEADWKRVRELDPTLLRDIPSKKF
jgi:protein O-mannosyl-transferase